jgi:hypothetical protein
MKSGVMVQGVRASVVATALLLAACADARPTVKKQPGDGLDWTALNGWSATIAAELGEKLGGCAVGDVDPARQGSEIVAVGSSGKVYLLAFDGQAWVQEVIGQAPGEMVQVALGDVDPARLGLEIVVVGMAAGGEDDGGEGAAHVLFVQDGEWQMKECHRSPALLHAAWVIPPQGSIGANLLLGGYAPGEQAVVRALTADNTWETREVPSFSGPAKNAVGYRDGVAVACSDGRVMLVRPTEEGFVAELLDEAPAGCARLASDGDKLLVARDDGVLALLDENGSQEIYREQDKLRGAVLANLDSVSPAIEAATAGYSRMITVLSQDATGWHPTQVFEGTDRFHHLASGRVETLGPEICLVACGYSGRVIVIRREPQG